MKEASGVTSTKLGQGMLSKSNTHLRTFPRFWRTGSVMCETPSCFKLKNAANKPIHSNLWCGFESHRAKSAMFIPIECFIATRYKLPQSRQ